VSPIVRHAVLPAVAPASILGLYFTPVSVFGCVNRGLLAVGIALAAAIGAVVATAIGTRARARREAAASGRWMLTTLILLVAVALLIGLG